jgi:hypothetical protein
MIGLPSVLSFGSLELQAEVFPDVLAGKKFICLAISEAFAGSDVGGMQTRTVTSWSSRVRRRTYYVFAAVWIRLLLSLSLLICERNLVDG